MIFSQKKVFLIFPENEPCTFGRSLKNERNPPRENILYFRKRKLRINVYFSQKSCSYVLGNGNPEEILYIPGNGTFLYSRQGIFRTMA